MNWRVPLSDVNLGSQEEAAVQRVVRSGWLSMGAETQSFEEEFADFVNTNHAIAVTNATAGLHLACLSLGLGPGDEVILPSLTFVATANAIRYSGATPVFADIRSLHNLNIDPKSIENAITDRTKAIMVMHYGGFACNMDEILEIAKANKLKVIEDAAHAVGSELEGRALGTWGSVGCYSFFANKNMTTGEGGMVVTNDDDLAKKIGTLRSHGMTTLTWDRHRGHAYTYDVVELGFNYRIDEVRSALGREQLKKVTRGNRKRAEIADLYREMINEYLPQVIIPFGNPLGLSSHYIQSILLPEGKNKLDFMENMKKQGIQTSWHYPPIHHFRIYQQEQYANRLPHTEETVARLVTVPLYPTMTDEHVSWVVNAMRNALS
ncbi:DegT/DnrJ/EryC1/StrS family aminotransferase [bacterium]|nr:DegT/DnrJ/EryC1/StrS family aminotransferase [bacterium]